MEVIRDIEQRSEDWFKLRLGSIGGSDINSVLAKGKGKSRRSLLYKKAAEILTGAKTESYQGAAMQRGIDFEPDARLYYELITGQEVEEVALIKGAPGLHYSPDGLIPEGFIEIKVFEPHVFVEFLDTGKIDLAYQRQMNHGFYIYNISKFCDFVAYCPEMPKPGAIKRIYPNHEIQAEIKTEADIFLKEVEQLVEKIGG